MRLCEEYLSQLISYLCEAQRKLEFRQAQWDHRNFREWKYLEISETAWPDLSDGSDVGPTEGDSGPPEGPRMSRECLQVVQSCTPAGRLGHKPLVGLSRHLQVLRDSLAPTCCQGDNQYRFTTHRVIYYHSPMNGNRIFWFSLNESRIFSINSSV